MNMSNIDKFNVNEEDFREEIIKTIDKSEVKKNLAYQVLMNKLSLTPYLYELEEVDPLFVNYREKNKSKINKFVLHPFQVEILNKLNDGKNLIVSAPTSFGKTASIFEYLNINRNTPLFDPYISIINGFPFLKTYTFKHYMFLKQLGLQLNIKKLKNMIQIISKHYDIKLIINYLSRIDAKIPR